jgi:nicotinamide mononucleotide transporter
VSGELAAPWIEIAAALLALVYVVLAIKQQIACWYAAFISSCLYVYVYFAARLYMEATLNIFYALMAVYGYWCWRKGKFDKALPISSWSLPKQVLALAGAALTAAATAYFLRHYTQAAWPFVDSLITWASVVATYMVAQKVYENWHWFFAIDALSAYLYLIRGLYPTMLLFLCYLVLIVIGMREWRRMRGYEPAPI